jgi:hypothetical protein
MTSKRPPVEPLSRPAWERIEAGLFERLEQGEHLAPPREPLEPASAASLLRPRWRWVTGAALAAAAAAVLWLQRPATEAPTAQRASTEIAPPRHESRIVSTDAPSETALGDAVLTLAARSDVAVSGSDQEGWLVRLEAGQVDCRVGPRRGRPPFVVQAGDTRVSVVGTRFTVIRSERGTSVAVTEGHVQVESGTDHVLLGPGETWPAPAPVQPPAVTPTPAEAPASGPTSKVATRAQQQFERAAALEAKNPRAALTLYRELARSGGPWAQNALYAQARLELELGRPERARPLLRRYLQRYPRGLNAADVEQQLQHLDGAAPR